MAINKALYDVTAVPREVAPPPPKAAAGKAAPSAPIAVDPVKGLADIMGNMMRQQLKMWEAAPQILNSMTNAFLAKPYSLAALRGVIENWLKPAPGTATTADLDHAAAGPQAERISNPG